MSKYNTDLGMSEEEDDPFQSSGSEWNSEKELEPVRKSSRRSSRVSKKRVRQQSSSSSEEEEEDEDEDDFEDEPKPRKRRQNGFNKKQNTGVESPTVDEKITRTTPVTKTLISKEFSTGSFLIAKKDANRGDPDKHPPIWRVDGKALLQKYEPVEHEGRISHQTTSIYTGWSPMDQDLYAPVSVTVKEQSNHNMIVELNWEKLKEINNESE